MRILSGAALAALLVGCLHGSDDDATPIAGVWHGSVVEAGGLANDVSCLIAVDGELVCLLLNPANGQIAGANRGKVAVAGDQFSASGTAYAAPGYAFLDGSSKASGSVSGTFTERASMTLTAVVGGGVFEGSASFDSSYDRGSSLAAVAGVYQQFTVAGAEASLSIDAQGNVFVQSSTGCVASGGIRVIASAFNAYRVQLAVTSCGDFNGSYSGLAATADHAGVDDLLLFAVFGPNAALLGAPIK